MAKSLQTAVSLHKAEIQVTHATWFVPLVSELLEISGSGRGRWVILALRGMGMLSL